jgi:hypothetical protein
MDSLTERLDASEVAELFERRGDGPHVTIYAPTHRTHPDTDQDPIRFRNLLDEARGTLASEGVRNPEIETILRPGADLLDDADFWNHQRDGLAVFLASGWGRVHRLTTPVPEFATVGPRFHVKPLLPLVAAGSHFYVLAISQNDVGLFQGSRNLLEPIEMPEAPADMAEALKYDDLEKESQFHVAGGGSPIVHGHGAGGEVDKVLIERFLRAVDDGLWPVVGDDDAPLVLAGVAYEQAIFRSVTRYRQVLDEGIEGNAEGLDLRDLHERAWSIVRPLFERDRQQAAERFTAAEGRGEPVAVEAADVARTASEGRIDTLFVPLGERRWGTVNPRTLEVTVDDEEGVASVDLFDHAAVHTLKASGTVYAVAPEDVPGDGPAAALLRF